MANKRSKLNSYKRLLKFLKPYIKLLIISIICMVAVSASNLYVPGLSRTSLIRSWKIKTSPCFI